MKTGSENARFLVVAEDAQTVERWLRPVLESLHAQGFPVSACLPAPHALPGIDTASLPPATGVRAVDLGLRASVLAARIADVRPDVLIAIGPDAGLAALPVARNLGVPNAALWLPEGSPLRAATGDAWRGRGPGALAPLRRATAAARTRLWTGLLEAVDLLVVPALLPDLPPGGQLVLPTGPGVDTALFSTEAGRDPGGRALRVRLGLRDARHVLGIFAGDAAALDRWRDLHDALGASRGGLRTLLITPPELRVGATGARSASGASGASGATGATVHVTGPLSPALLDACDAFFVPGGCSASLHAALAAMAMRVPVLASEGTPVGAQVMALGGGVALAPDELRQGLGELLTDPGLRTMLGARGQLRVRAEAAGSVVAGRVLDAFAALVRRKYGEPLHLSQDGQLRSESEVQRRRRDLMRDG